MATGGSAGQLPPPRIAIAGRQINETGLTELSHRRAFRPGGSPPALSAGSVLVANKHSVISAGTERAMMEFAGKGLVAKARARPDIGGRTGGYGRTAQGLL